MLTTMAWLAAVAAGALPFVFAQNRLSVTDAFFESISGFTTTGSTVILGLDEYPPGLLLWRSLTNWMGGLGIIVMAIMLLPFLRVGGMQLFRPSSSERSDKIFPRAVQMGRWIGSTYLLLTLLCAISSEACRDELVRCLQSRDGYARDRGLLDQGRLDRFLRQPDNRMDRSPVHDVGGAAADLLYTRGASGATIDARGWAGLDLPRRPRRRHSGHDFMGLAASRRAGLGSAPPGSLQCHLGPHRYRLRVHRLQPVGKLCRWRLLPVLLRRRLCRLDIGGDKDLSLAHSFFLAPEPVSQHLPAPRGDRPPLTAGGL